MRLVFRHREDVAIGTLPDAEIVLFDSFILFKHDAAIPQKGGDLLDVFDLFTLCAMICVCPLRKTVT
jgi:hypothetical protein